MSWYRPMVLACGLEPVVGESVVSPAAGSLQNGRPNGWSDSIDSDASILSRSSGERLRRS